MKLVYRDSKMPVYVGDRVVLSRGEEVEVMRITEPHKPSSTGRVTVKSMGDDDWTMDYYPSVIGAEWIDREDQYSQEKPGMVFPSAG